jgi:hypothetical protein
MPPSVASFVGAARLDDDEEIAKVAKKREELEEIFIVRRIGLGDIGMNARR